MDDESQELEASGQEPEGAVTAPASAPTAPNPRRVRARRRRRRRRLGTLLFLLVAGGVVAAAYFAVSGGDDTPTDKQAAAGSSTTTTEPPPFFATYKVTSGLNVRQGPGTTFPAVGTVEQGHEITAVCVVDGEAINGTDGLPNTKWLKIAGSFAVGYVSAAYVITGDDLTSGKVPACPAS